MFVKSIHEFEKSQRPMTENRRTSLIIFDKHSQGISKPRLCFHQLFAHLWGVCAISNLFVPDRIASSTDELLILFRRHEKAPLAKMLLGAVSNMVVRFGVVGRWLLAESAEMLLAAWARERGTGVVVEEGC